jgi:hypothetical protein
VCLPQSSYNEVWEKESDDLQIFCDYILCIIGGCGWLFSAVSAKFQFYVRLPVMRTGLILCLFLYFVGIALAHYSCGTEFKLPPPGSL